MYRSPLYQRGRGGAGGIPAKTVDTTRDFRYVSVNISGRKATCVPGRRHWPMSPSGDAQWNTSYGGTNDMKKLTTFIMMAAFAAMVACSADTTEIAWVNSSASTEAINNIVWASGDQQWSTPGGYADADVKTETKEVNRMTGIVECDIDDGGGNFVPATINSINGNPVNSLVLNEGSSEVFVLVVHN